MEIKKEFRNEYVFDNTKTNISTIEIIINNELILLNYESIIDTQFSGGNIKGNTEPYNKLLNIGMFSNAPCGGFVNLFKVKGSQGNIYIIYSGVNEVSNSHYIVTIHKIIGQY